MRPNRGCCRSCPMLTTRRSCGKRGGRYGPHNIYEDKPYGPTFKSDRFVVTTWFGGGVRIYDLADPVHPREGRLLRPRDAGRLTQTRAADQRRLRRRPRHRLRLRPLHRWPVHLGPPTCCQSSLSFRPGQNGDGYPRGQRLRGRVTTMHQVLGIEEERRGDQEVGARAVARYRDVVEHSQA